MLNVKCGVYLLVVLCAEMSAQLNEGVGHYYFDARARAQRKALLEYRQQQQQQQQARRG